MLRLFVLLAAICGWLAIACSSSSDSGQGGGGASAGGNDETGGVSTMPPNPDGTCQDGYALSQKADGPGMVCIKINDGSGGSGSAGGNGGGGSSGSAGDTPPIADAFVVGGSGGEPDAAPQTEVCPPWQEVTDDRSPCLLGGKWISMDVPEGWVQFTITKIDSTNFKMHIDGESTGFEGIEFTGSALPFEFDSESFGVNFHITIDIDGDGYLQCTSQIKGDPSIAYSTFRRN